MKLGQNIKSAVLEKLGSDIIGHLGLDDGVDADKWEFRCEGDGEKEYLDKMTKEMASRIASAITGALSGDGIAAVKEIIQKVNPNLADCSIR